MVYDVKWDRHSAERCMREAEERAFQSSLPWIGCYAYRFVDATYASSSPWDDSDTYVFYDQVEIQAFMVRNETPCGITIWTWGRQGLEFTTRFINLDARKKFAHPDIDEAIESYIARKHRQYHLYLARAEKAKKLAASMRPSPVVAKGEQSSIMEPLDLL
jgi:hypothetical protein